MDKTTHALVFGDPLEIVQEIEIWSYYQMLFAQTRIPSGEWNTYQKLGFWDKDRSPNLSQTSRPSDNFYLNKKELVIQFILLFQQTTDWKSKKSKIETLPKN